MKKKILSLVLAMLMVGGPASVVAADEPSAADYTPAIEFLASYGIYHGESEEDLAADEDIERYQMALFVGRISTGWVDDRDWEDGPLNTSGFTDIEDGEEASAYLGAISYAQQKGIIEGYGNGEFGPYDGITYQDALTMVCRTLGYTGEEWPWGYIEKAVELDLVNGIVDVAYTDILTRGEVAQIIYNALFAAKNGGSTLAKDVFDMSDWTPIIITASDAAVFEKAGEVVTADDIAEKTWVAFKIFDPATGYIAEATKDEVYYAEAADLGLDVAKHEDELAVGHVYWAIFEESNTNFVDVLEFETTYVDTLWNAGKTDDAGEALEYAVNKHMENRTVVSQYTPANYISNTKKLKPEIILYDSIASYGEFEQVLSENKLAIDWTTGDILAKQEDGTYAVEWYWNSTRENYFKIAVDEKFGIIGIEWMTEFDLEDYLVYVDGAEYAGMKRIDGVNDSAWSSLILEDPNLDGVAERGYYEEYGLGYVAAATFKCAACDADVAGYKITPVTNAMTNTATDLGTGDLSSNGTMMGATPIEICPTHGWFAEDFGYKADGYVVYSYDAETKGAKIVKTIDGTDADSKVINGVLRGYSVDLAKVVIDEKAYTAKYDNLINTGFFKVNDNDAPDKKSMYAVGLDSMLGQYVQVVIMDGEVVAMNLVNEGNNGTYLVVKDFVGMSNDGYIAVEAYNIANGDLGLYFIASYNGWKQGDYYYFLTEEKVEEAFAAGTMYYVKSYDKNLDVYNVELVGDWNRQGTAYEVDDEMIGLEEISICFADDGYKSLDGGDTWSKMDAADTYIILPERIDGRDIAPIYYHQGKVTNADAWTVDGFKITGLSSDAIVVVNATNISGFNRDAYQSGMYLYEGGKVYEAAYEDAYNTLFGEGIGPMDRYIVGATSYKVEAFDLYTGNNTVAIADRNIDLEEGNVYVTISNEFIEEFKPLMDEENLNPEWAFFWEMANTYYTDRDIDPRFYDTADYLFGAFELEGTTPITEITKADVDAALVRDAAEDPGFFTGWYTTLRERVAEDVKVWTVDFANRKMAVTAGIPAGATDLDCAYIYDVDAGTAVVYVWRDFTDLSAQTNSVTFATATPGVEVEMTFTYDVNYDADGDITDATITAIKFEYIGADAMGHGDRALAGLAFGHESEHLLGSYYVAGEKNGLFTWDGGYVLVEGQDLYINRDAAKFTTYSCVDELCDLVKAVEFTDLSIEVEADEDEIVGLLLNISPALKTKDPTLDETKVEFKDAKWDMFAKFSVTEDAVTIAANESYTVNESGFGAYIPEDVQ